MASIEQAQKALGKDFDLGGESSQGALKLDAVEKVMYDAANKFIGLAQQRINAKGKVDRGNMSDISVSAINKKGNKYTLTIGYDESNPASKYYDFQNKGVKGIKSGKPNSPYQFRTLKVSKNMVEAILQWYLRHKNYIRNEDQRKGLTPLQIKRKTLTNAVDPKKKLLTIAKNTAKRIKERGIGRVGFFDDNEQKAFGEDFKAKLSQALGQDIALTITQTFKK
jgi:uncharacterized protein YxeA